MESHSQTPGNGFYGSVPEPNEAYESRGYGNASQHDFAHGTDGNTVENTGMLDRSASTASTAAYREMTPSRSGTLKKKSSISRKSSLGRSGSRRSTRAGSIGGVGYAGEHENYNSALYTPIPTQGSPTEILANRFQAWRTLLKSLITYFREIQSSYDSRSKAIMKVSNVLGNTTHPSVFITDGGLADASRILSDYHKHSVTEANKSRDIEQDVIQALSGLRSDLSQKIKEIKSLSGDFKNSVEKEKESTRKAVDQLAEALQHADHGDNAKTDPFIVRLGVDRMVERQIDEENYLHRAYLNLESSGRELEAIVVGEIQKAYNAMASILKREGDDAYNTVEQLRGGPIAMPKDLEWSRFVETDPHFVNPRLPLRRVEDVDYPGKRHPQAAEIRAGMLERKSKYLKSYAPGWYVLSPTHLHEFKSADNIYSQPPVMSLYLADQKLGSHSESGASSHKFMLKGRQSGGMHRGHSWVFRAESHETMMAWFVAIKALTEKTGEERNAFVRQHARSMSQNSHRNSVSSDGDGLEEDEADRVPYSAQSSVINQPIGETRPQRPVPGGRFPSDLQIPRQLAASPSSESSEPDHDMVAAATALPGTGVPFPGNPANDQSRYEDNPYRLEGVATHEPMADRDEKIPVVTPGLTATASTATAAPAISRDEPPTPVSYEPNPVDRFNPTIQQEPAYLDRATPATQQQSAPVAPRNEIVQPTQTFVLPVEHEAPAHQPQPDTDSGPPDQPRTPLTPTAKRQNTSYGEWMSPVAAAGVGVGAGVLGSEAYQRQQAKELPQSRDLDEEEPTERRGLQEESLQPRSVDEQPLPVRGHDQEYFQPRGYDEKPSQAREFDAQPSQARDYNAQPVPTSGYEDETPRDLTAGHTAMPTSNQPATNNAAAFTNNNGLSGATTVGTAPFPYMVATSSNVPQSEHVVRYNAGTTNGTGLHETGQIFPRVLRHDTDMSISQLHVPGEFPGNAGAAGEREPSTTTDGGFVRPSAWDMARE